MQLFLELTIWSTNIKYDEYTEIQNKKRDLKGIDNKIINSLFLFFEEIHVA